MNSELFDLPKNVSRSFETRKKKNSYMYVLIVAVVKINHYPGGKQHGKAHHRLSYSELPDPGWCADSFQ